jgi:hypothetical protein
MLDLFRFSNESQILNFVPDLYVGVDISKRVVLGIWVLHFTLVSRQAFIPNLALFLFLTLHFHTT